MSLDSFSYKRAAARAAAVKEAADGLFSCLRGVYEEMYRLQESSISWSTQADRLYAKLEDAKVLLAEGANLIWKFAVESPDDARGWYDKVNRFLKDEEGDEE